MSTDISKMSAAQLAKLAKEAKAKEQAENAAKRKEYDKLRDTYIDTVFGKMQELSEQLNGFKSESVKLGIELHTKMYEAYGRIPKDGIYSYTLTSADGMRKVMIERQWRCEYDETAEVAIGKIKEVLHDKFANRNNAMYGMLERVLLRNNKGDYDERLVAKLRAEEDKVNDPRFGEALTMLAQAYKPTTSQTYIRAYRKDDAGKWHDITMNWSRM